MKVRGVLLAGAAGVAVTPMAANAADLPTKALMYSPAPIATWEGLYVGAHVGAAWQHGDNGVGGASGYSANSTSFIGGGQIGYNWQRGNYVYGVEADISGLSDSKDQGTSYFTYSNTISWLATFRGRMGLAVGDTMVYMTGGLAVGGLENKLTFTPGSGDPNKSSSKTRVGWVIGGGIEHMWNRNWSFGLEGLFVDFGRDGNAGYTGNCGNGTCPTSFSNQAMIGRFKVNYRF